MGHFISILSSIVAVFAPIFQWITGKRKNTLIVQSWYDKEAYVRLENISGRTIILKRISNQRNCSVKDFCDGYVIEPGRGFRIYFNSFDDSKNDVRFKIHLGVSDEVDRICTVLRNKKKWTIK